MTTVEQFMDEINASSHPVPARSAWRLRTGARRSDCAFPLSHGHAFSMDNLLTRVSKAIDKSLWNTLRVREESSLLLRHTAAQVQENQDEAMASRLEQKAQQA